MTNTAPTTLDELVKVLASLPGRPALERARIARSLDRRARAIIGEVGEQAVFDAVHEVVGTHKRSYADVAAALGVTPSAVAMALSRYRRRRAAAP